MKRSGSTFTEYVVILGMVSAVFVGMNTYIKRGIQGRVKEMTDFFVVNDLNETQRQVAEVTPLVISTTNTDTQTNTTEERFIRLGGGSEIDLNGAVNTTAVFHSEDYIAAAPPGAFISSNAGNTENVQNPHNQTQQQ